MRKSPSPLSSGLPPSVAQMRKTPIQQNARLVCRVRLHLQINLILQGRLGKPALPPVSRAFLKSEVDKTEKLKTSVMPDYYGTRYSRKQLLDLVAFLKTAGMEATTK